MGKTLAEIEVYREIVKRFNNIALRECKLNCQSRWENYQNKL